MPAGKVMRRGQGGKNPRQLHETARLDFGSVAGRNRKRAEKE